MRSLKFTLLILSCILTSVSSCRSQSKIDAVLSKKADSLNVKDIDFLIKSGYIRNVDVTVIGTELIFVTQKNDTKNWTIRRLLDSVKAQLKKMDDFTAAKYNYGKDSVFIRDPKGNRMFIGMGQLSFERMVAKASLNLPENYKGDYNLPINSPESIKTLALLVSSSEYPTATGNVLLFERDSGKLKKMKIGDIFEISKRVLASEGFAPFLSFVK